MKTVKLFETSEMTEELFETLRDFGYFMEDAAIEYVVGTISEDYLESSFVDEWFVKNGAKMKERVLVYHGSFALPLMKDCVDKYKLLKKEFHYFVVKSEQGKYCTGYYGWDGNIHSDHQIFREDELPFDIGTKGVEFIQVGFGERPSPYNVQEMLHD
jgi:hypothetical protein